MACIMSFCGRAAEAGQFGRAPERRAAAEAAWFRLGLLLRNVSTIPGIYTYMYIYIFICIYIYICIHIYLFIYVYVRTYIHTSLYIYIYMYMFTYSCIFDKRVYD